jgi:hypothetical protein
MNLGGPNFGLQHIGVFCEATAPQYNNLGMPSDGKGQYEYVGCFEEKHQQRPAAAGKRLFQQLQHK